MGRRMNGEPPVTESSDVPGRWIATGRGRRQARIAGRSRHPIAWLRSALGRRRGVAAPDNGLPTGTRDVLERIVELPLSVWTYGFDHPTVRHMGPMAQDFAAAFGLGHTPRRIDTVDAIGVCLAGIQALHQRIEALEKGTEPDMRAHGHKLEAQTLQHPNCRTSL
jgi:hypothetical protein